MECKEVRFLGWFVRPGHVELETPELLQLQHHLQSCSDCAAVFQAEQRLDVVLGQAMQAVPLPPGLKGRLLVPLEKQRRWRRWTSRALAMAAAIILLVGLAYYWWAPRPAFDLGQFVTIVSSNAGASPEDVERWFQEQHFAVVVPRQLNLRLLDSCDIVEIQGQRVPHLLLVQRSEGRVAVAHVFVLSQSQFALPQRPLEIHPTSSHTIEERTFADIPGCLYLFMYTGGSLDAFFAAPVVN